MKYLPVFLTVLGLDLLLFLIVWYLRHPIPQ